MYIGQKPGPQIVTITGLVSKHFLKKPTDCNSIMLKFSWEIGYSIFIIIGNCHFLWSQSIKCDAGLITMQTVGINN
jgi:hypothetical protein